MLTLCKIDGKSYDVLISAIEETYNVIEGANSGIAIALTSGYIYFKSKNPRILSFFSHIANEQLIIIKPKST